MRAMFSRRQSEVLVVPEEIAWIVVAWFIDSLPTTCSHNLSVVVHDDAVRSSILRVSLRVWFLRVEDKLCLAGTQRRQTTVVIQHCGTRLVSVDMSDSLSIAGYYRLRIHSACVANHFGVSIRIESFQVRTFLL